MQVISKRNVRANVGTRSRPNFMVVVRATSAGPINPSIRKDEEKVADFVKVTDLPPKAVFCRCWRSEKFPYCDGRHVAHNKETGDNVGPLVLENPKQS
jgi:CDGSH-type Zn-finger protein